MTITIILSDYTKPLTYSEFLAELGEACNKGDTDAKQIIEELAPGMARLLKEKGEWNSPTITIETKEGPFKLFDGTGDCLSVFADIHDELMGSLLGELHELAPLAPTTEGNDSDEGDADYYQTLSNLITDIDITENASTSSSSSDLSPNTARAVLKDLQPNRELPSKDHQMRFAAGQLHADKAIHPDHDLIEYTYWFVKPNKVIQSTSLNPTPLNQTVRM